MRKEITWQEARELEDGTQIWVHEKIEGGLECRTCIKNGTALLGDKLEFIYCLYGHIIELMYGDLRLFIETDKNTIKIGEMEYEVSREILDKVLELITSIKKPELTDDAYNELVDAFEEGYRWIAKSEKGESVITDKEPMLIKGFVEISFHFKTKLSKEDIYQSIPEGTKWPIKDLLKRD